MTCSADRVGYVLAEGATAGGARQRMRSVAVRCEGELKIQLRIKSRQNEEPR